MCSNGNNSGSGNCSKQATTGSSDYINSVVRQTPGQMSVCPFVHRLAFGRRISIEIDFVLCSLKFYVHKVYFDLFRRVALSLHSCP